MSMSSRELVCKTVRFEGADRIPFSLAGQYGTDFANVSVNPSPDARPRSGTDEWGCVWANIGISKLGEVKEFPIKNWANWNNLSIPDIRDSKRWEGISGARERSEGKFLLARGISLYERVHFLRGLENTWMDIYAAPEELARLIDILVEMNLYALERYVEAGADGYMWCDDWGLQNQLMISPESWQEIWRPRYARVYQAARDAGLLTFLHSCGDITSILDHQRYRRIVSEVSVHLFNPLIRNHQRIIRKKFSIPIGCTSANRDGTRSCYRTSFSIF